MRAVAQIEIDEILVGHFGFLGQRFEVGNHIRSQAERDLLPKVPGEGFLTESVKSYSFLILSDLLRLVIVFS